MFFVLKQCFLCFKTLMIIDDIILSSLKSCNISILNIIDFKYLLIFLSFMSCGRPDIRKHFQNIIDKRQ